MKPQASKQQKTRPDPLLLSALQAAIGQFPARQLIKQWLKAGYGEEEMLHPTDTGCPQGGVLSPLLLNRALHGMEQARGIGYTNLAKGCNV